MVPPRVRLAGSATPETVGRRVPLIRRHLPHIPAPTAQTRCLRLAHVPQAVATRLDDAGLSARQIADHLGHSRPSLTQDSYLGRGIASPRTAAAIRRAS